MLLIGDVHCNIRQYQLIIERYAGETLQLGDFGFYKEHKWHLDNLDSEKHKVCFGNHDDQSFLQERHSCGDFKYFEKYDLMSIRGAYSIDKSRRTTGVDWWPNEEMTYLEMNDTIAFYEKRLPSIVVTHDCPRKISKKLFDLDITSITARGLDEMFEIHQPKMWIFGHHHCSTRTIVNGTLFICLSELETFELNI